MSTLREWLNWYAARWWGQLLLILLVVVGGIAILSAFFFAFTALCDLPSVDCSWPVRLAALIVGVFFGVFSSFETAVHGRDAMLGIIGIIVVGLFYSVLRDMLHTLRGIDHGVALIAAQLRVNALPPEDRHDDWPDVHALEERDEQPRP